MKFKTNINKRGSVDDLFDYLFLVMISVLVFYFLYSTLSGSQDIRNDKEIARVVDFEEFHADLVQHQYEQYNNIAHEYSGMSPYVENNQKRIVGVKS